MASASSATPAELLATVSAKTKTKNIKIKGIMMGYRYSRKRRQDFKVINTILWIWIEGFSRNALWGSEPAENLNRIHQKKTKNEIEKVGYLHKQQCQLEEMPEEQGKEHDIAFEGFGLYLPIPPRMPSLFSPSDLSFSSLLIIITESGKARFR